jgi:hypothetical protein
MLPSFSLHLLIVGLSQANQVVRSTLDEQRSVQDVPDVPTLRGYFLRTHEYGSCLMETCMSGV